jgi:very-long-chain ceramide synthase
MAQEPTWYYRTEQFWIGRAFLQIVGNYNVLINVWRLFSDYPHWDMKPELKSYYLVQSAYWCQQLLVLVLKLEKPRTDYNELVAHHIVTLWLVGCVHNMCNLVKMTF